MNKLQNVYTIGRGAKNLSNKKWKINLKLESSSLSLILSASMPFVMEKSKSKKGPQYLKDSLYSTEVHWDISEIAKH